MKRILILGFVFMFMASFPVMAQQAGPTKDRLIEQLEFDLVGWKAKHNAEVNQVVALNSQLMRMQNIAKQLKAKLEECQRAEVDAKNGKAPDNTPTE